MIDEIDIDRYDERAAVWWLGQRAAIGMNEAHDPARLLEQLRGHIHPMSSIHAALQPYFEFGHPVFGPYLHRWEPRPGLRDPEVDLIATGLLPAVGCRQVATRRHEGASR